MTGTPRPNSPLPDKKSRSASIRLLLILAAVAALLVLTALTGKQPVEQTATPTTTPGIIQLTATPTLSPSDTGGADETTGIILAGSFLVLIVLGGTLGATRRKS
jgi:hypothetical protein